jgi:2'-5' RNA ligase
MARLFIAVDLPADVKGALEEIAPIGARGVRGTKSEHMHVTVHFLGDRDCEQIEVALAGVKSEPFELPLRGVGQFKTRDGGAILWAGIDVPDSLRSMHERVGTALAAIGFHAETRPYTPHVTLARCRAGYDKRAVQEFLKRNAEFQAPPFAVREFALYSSIIGKDGPAYTREVAWRLV